METLFAQLCVLILMMLLTLALPYPLLETANIAGDPFEAPAYTRFSDVERACGSVLSSAAELSFNPNTINSLKSELSFAKGDWGQDSGNSPLMPLDSPVNDTVSRVNDTVSLASFVLAYVNPHGHSRNAVNISGALVLGLSRNESMSDTNRPLFPEFRFWLGSPELTILFEGVYTETEGERVLCMLGNSKLPSRQSGSTDPWEWAKGYGLDNFQPPLVEDDKILLVLRYPKTFTLTSRAVRGEMKSLNELSSIKYFDKVQLSSQLGSYSNYQFGSEKVVSKACDPYPYHGDQLDHLTDIYRGSGLCEILDRFVSGEILTVVPNWNCNSTDEDCSKLGPFASGRQIKATDGGFANVGLMMQDIRCEPIIGKNNANSSARVSAVLRVVPPWENQYLAAQRTGLSKMTLSAEGVWNYSVGLLCMVGCLGLADADARCDSRISLYVPTSLSIKQRNIIFGQIDGIGKTSKYYPLSFGRPVHPMELLNRFSSSPINSYKYSKIEMAGAFMNKSASFDFGTLVKKSLLSYPKLEERGDEQVGLSSLSDDLSLHILAVPDPLPKVRTQKPFLQLEILSLGSSLRRYWAYQNFAIANTSAPPIAKPATTEKQILLNVSAEITLSGSLYSNFTMLFLEGLYNPDDGKMYLIGCRDVRASWNLLFKSKDHENGLDCLIEVKVEYPPTTAGWLMNPTARVSITSQRTDDDPLHFSSVKLQTLPTLYRGQREDILSGKGLEGVLRILTLSVAIACILSQLFYIRAKSGIVPYISLVMLGVQALGYSIPLITGAEALFTRMSTSSYENRSYELQNQWFQIMDYLVKVLVLGVFLLTLRLAQKVLKSRIRLQTRSPLEPRRVPNDKWVLLISFTLHAIGFLIVIVVHYVEASKRPARLDTYMDYRGNNHKLHEWGMQLEEYVGLVQDFFLLPQIIGNFLWQIDCRPLRKAYYVGITVVRLLPHIYDYVKAPVFNPYFSEEYEFVNPSLDFYSRFGDVAIPVTAAVLAAIIYIQQRWSYKKLSQTLRSGHKALLPLGSRVYERLPSLSVEAELVSGANESSTQDAFQKNKE